MPTGTKRGCATTAAALLAVTISPAAFAQPDLPPPPPPPLESSTSLPPLPPPAPAPAPAPAPPRPATPSPPIVVVPAPRHAEEVPSPPPPYRTRRRREVVVVVSEIEPPRPVAITFDPLGLAYGRLSAGLELKLAPHHSLCASPNVLVFDAPRGGRNDLVSEGLGFASEHSSSLGIELGWHFWPRWSRSLRGAFVGPSLLLGTTTYAYPAATPSAAPYWGLALDAGVQRVFPGGFTLGGGLGLGYARMADQNAVFPRLLLQLGWSF